MKVTRRKILFGVAMLMTLVIFLPVVVHFRMKATVEAYNSQLRAQGEMLTIAELIPLTPTNGPNRAAALLSAASRMRFRNDGFELQRMKFLSPGRARVAWAQEILPTDAVTNAWPRLKMEMGNIAGSLLEIRAALENPSIRFDLNYGQSWRLSLAHLSPLMEAGQRLSDSASLELHDGFANEALEDLRACVALPKAWRDEPLWISQMRRYELTDIAFRATWEALQFPGWNDKQLAELQSEWQDIEFLSAAEASLSMERVLGEKNIATGRISSAARDEMLSLGRIAGGSSNLFLQSIEFGKEIVDDPNSAAMKVIDRYPRYWAWKWWWSYDEDLYRKQAWQTGIEAVRVIRNQTCFAPALEQVQKAGDRLTESHSHHQDHFQPGTFGVPPTIHGFLKRIAIAEIEKEMLVAAIALKRFHLRHGTFPAALASLTPEFVPSLPRDWIDGKPLRYRLKEDGQFVLYSVGEDGVDDGGDPTPKTKKASKYMPYGRDWVWPAPASGEEIAVDNTAMAITRSKQPSTMMMRYILPRQPPTNTAR